MAAFTSTSSTPHVTNLEIQANRLTFRGIHGDQYTFPRKDGTNGQVITTDGNGRLTFTTVSGTGTVTPSSTDTFTNKSGSNSQWTNDEAYIKADSTDTSTNKSGSNSQWTNDEGYLTSVPAQSFASLTGKPTTISGYGITDAFDGDYNNLSNTPTIPTNNNQLTNGAGYTLSLIHI